MVLGTTLNFDFHLRTRFVSGEGLADRTGDYAAELNLTHALLVTDPGIVSAGHADRIEASLRVKGIEVTRFENVIENPTAAEVGLCVAIAREAKIDGIVGLGGGSAMDTAKGCNFVLTNGGHIRDYWGMGKAAKPMLPLIAIPTTGGTGSEGQSFALIADEQTHMKMACGDPKAAARVAILDPTLTVTQPRNVTANTGMDAISHAVESAVTSRRNPISFIFSSSAFRLLMRNYPVVLEEPRNLQARAAMQLGAALAGLAIENSMLGAAHAMANPLTAHYNIIHGQAVGALLPTIVRYNGEDPLVASLYNSIAVLLPEASTGAGGAEAIASQLESYLDIAGIPRTLDQFNIEPDLLPTLAAEAAKQWTGTFNPRPVGDSEFLELYQRAMEASFK